MNWSRRVAAITLCAIVAACRGEEPNIVFLQSTASFSSNDIQTITRVAITAVREVRVLLPAVPADIELTVRAGTDVIAETGETATALPPSAIVWTVDPSRAGGAAAVASRWLRATLFHELHHLARSTTGTPISVIDHAIYEGLASVFERDVADVRTPWAEYPSDVEQWATELRHLPSDASLNKWIYTHPDGRRWIGMRVGSYWVDRAMARSGKSSAELALTPTAEILRLAQ